MSTNTDNIIRVDVSNITIGSNAGGSNLMSSYNQGDYGIAIGYNSGVKSQEEKSIAIGYLAGKRDQSNNSIAIGSQAAEKNQNYWSIAIGNFAGHRNQSNNSIAIGTASGFNTQEEKSIAIGNLAGNTDQSNNSIAIGTASGFNTQEEKSIAIGYLAGNTDQSNNSIAIGSQSGEQRQKQNCIAIGHLAGQKDQSNNSIAIGYRAGQTDQSNNSIAIGLGAGTTTQKENSIAIGYLAGHRDQSNNSIAIGYQAGRDIQGENSIAIGRYAATYKQSNNSIAIGQKSGFKNVDASNIAIGYCAGHENIRSNTISIGYEAGYKDMSLNSIAIGHFAGRYGLAKNSINIGRHSNYAATYNSLIKSNIEGIIDLNSSDNSANNILSHTISLRTQPTGRWGWPLLSKPNNGPKESIVINSGNQTVFSARSNVPAYNNIYIASSKGCTDEIGNPSGPCFNTNNNWDSSHNIILNSTDTFRWNTFHENPPLISPLPTLSTLDCSFASNNIVINSAIDKNNKVGLFGGWMSGYGNPNDFGPPSIVPPLFNTSNLNRFNTEDTFRNKIILCASNIPVDGSLNSSTNEDFKFNFKAPDVTLANFQNKPNPGFYVTPIRRMGKPNPLSPVLLAYIRETKEVVFTDISYAQVPTINNNGANRIITGSATANTLEAQSSLEWDGTDTLTVKHSSAFPDFILNTDAGGGAARLFSCSNGSFRIKNNDAFIPNASAKTLVIGQITGNRGMSIVSGTTSTGNIYFGDTQNSNSGRITYNHNNNKFSFVTNSSPDASGITINSLGRVGIGTTNPQTQLHLYGSNPTITLEGNTLGYTEGSILCRCDDFYRGGGMYIYNKNINFTTGVQVRDPDEWFIGRGYANNTNFRINYDSSSNLIPGGTSAQTTNTLFDMQPNGNYTFVGNPTSDERLKVDIHNYTENVLDKVKQLTPKTFKLNPEVYNSQNTRHGFIAQDVETILPNLVTGDISNDNERLGLDYNGLTSILVKAIQELEARVTALES